MELIWSSALNSQYKVPSEAQLTLPLLQLLISEGVLHMPLKAASQSAVQTNASLYTVPYTVLLQSLHYKCKVLGKRNELNCLLGLD